MKFKIRFADQFVGIFVLTALVAIAVMLIFMGLNQRWFAKNYSFESRFISANSLSVGMAIKLKGFKIGSIDEILLNKDNTVRIKFHIFDTYYDRVKENSILELVVSPIGLGGGGLVFYPGKGEGDPLPEGSYIPSLDFEDGQNIADSDLADMPNRSDAITDIVNDIGPVLKNANKTIVSLNDLVKTTNSTLRGDIQGPVGDTVKQVISLLAEVEDVIGDLSANVDQLTGQAGGVIEEATGTIAQVDDIIKSTLDQVDGIIQKTDTVMANVATISSDFTRVSSNIESLSKNLEAMSGHLKDPKGIVKTVLDPKGSVATLLDDGNELYDQIQSILKDVEKSVNQLAAFVQYVNSTAPQITGILEEGKQTLDSGKNVLEGVKNNPLIRGGIPERKDQPTTFTSNRDGGF